MRYICFRTDFNHSSNFSIWIYQFRSKFSKNHISYGENPELRTFFERLILLLQLPVTPIFIFDGPSRPLYKRGKVVRFTESWIVPYIREFIEAFGFDHFTVSIFHIIMAIMTSSYNRHQAKLRPSLLC